MKRSPRQHIEKHLGFLRQLECCVCGNNIETQAAHLRFSDASVVKENPGVGQKAHDFWCLPLCGKHHDEQHRAGDERDWWASKGIDPIKLAMTLYVHTDDHARASLAIRRQREFA
jgi:hypothetical protein